MIIGLVGYAQSGKDTAASFLVEELGFERRAFADKLKAIALATHPDLATFVELFGWEEAKKISPYRRYLQDLGMAVRTHLGQDAWVDAALPRDEFYTNDIVITDVRFHNEIDRIRDLGGVLVEIRRPGVGPVNDHVSEHEWEQRRPFDFTIDNAETLYDLRYHITHVASVAGWPGFPDLPDSIFVSQDEGWVS